jgi:hypothetical protein
VRLGSPRVQRTRGQRLAQRRPDGPECRAALRMIREAIEMHTPPGSVPSEEYVEPPFTAEAEALVKGVLALAYRSEK